MLSSQKDVFKYTTIFKCSYFRQSKSNQTFWGYFWNLRELSFPLICHRGITVDFESYHIWRRKYHFWLLVLKRKNKSDFIVFKCKYYCFFSLGKKHLLYPACSGVSHLDFVVVAVYFVYFLFKIWGHAAHHVCHPEFSNQKGI